MEEDIKILKELVKFLNNGEIEDKYGKFDSEIQAIENILAELEPIRKTGIPAEVLVAEWERLEDLEDDTDCLKHRIKELEKENKELKQVLNATEKAGEELAHDLLWESIPKSVIREKIEKLEDSLWEKGYEDEKSYAIKVLKKMLEEEK